MSLCGYEISILAAHCHCVLCFCPKLDSLLALQGCYLNIAIHGALQEKRIEKVLLCRLISNLWTCQEAMTGYGAISLQAEKAVREDSGDC